jgi:hypothetical protein
LTDQAGDSDLRRRAAWLLALLVLVAVLIVVLILAFTHSSTGDQHHGAAPDDSLVATPSTTAGTTSPGHRSTKRPATSARSTPTSPSAARTPVSCTRLCVVSGDLGNSVAAINGYRVKHGQRAVPGTVSAAAQRCALSNGSKCSGGWAESQVESPTGAAALAKIVPLGKLLDPGLKSFDVGWAYDPAGHEYYFAIVRHG